MKRNLLAVASAALLSLLLSLVSLTVSFVIARHGPPAPFSDNSVAFASRLTFIRTWVAQPLVVISVGAYVGYLARRREILFALLGVSPAVYWYLAIDSWRWDGWWRALIYALLASGSSFAVVRWRARKLTLRVPENAIF